MTSVIPLEVGVAVLLVLLPLMQPLATTLNPITRIKNRAITFFMTNPLL